MITSEIKAQIDKLWDIFWMGGITNPPDVIEQMTYLMFIRDLEANGGLSESIFTGTVRIRDKEIEGKRLRWSELRRMPALEMYTTMQEWVFPVIRTLHHDKNSAYARYMDDAIFKIPTPHMLTALVKGIDTLYDTVARQTEDDARGDAYEYMLSKLSTAGVLGQFRTPGHIVRMMVELMQPDVHDRICDPACGTGSFLVKAAEYIKNLHSHKIADEQECRRHFMHNMFHGFDTDRTMLRIAAMNMMLHGISAPNIRYQDSLSRQNTEEGTYSLILANPPFKGRVHKDHVAPDLTQTCASVKSELLFLALFLRLLKVGGRCACIVPDGVLFGSSKAHRNIRRALVEQHCLHAIISLPAGVFRPYAGVSAAILIFTKTACGGTDKVWFYDMKADGFSLDDKRMPCQLNDIPDVVARFRNLAAESTRRRTDASFFVPKEEIVDNNYDLSVNLYKQTLTPAIEYPSPRKILADIRLIQSEIDRNLAELHAMLGEEDSPDL